MPPAATGGTGIKAPGGIEHDFIGVASIHQVFKKGIDQNGQVRHQKGTDAFRVLLGEQISGVVKHQFLPHHMPGMTALGLNHLGY